MGKIKQVTINIKMCMVYAALSFVLLVTSGVLASSVNGDNFTFFQFWKLAFSVITAIGSLVFCALACEETDLP